jgi:hypothetical protein
MLPDALASMLPPTALVTVSCGVGAVIGIVSESAPCTITAPGATPTALAVLGREPATASGPVIRYVPVQVIDAPGFRLVGLAVSQASAPRRGSDTRTPWSRTLPVFEAVIV